MKIAVFGASGATGIQVVQQALDKGMAVKAFVRDPSKITLQNPKLEIVQGDVLDPNTVEKVVQGVDAVILTLGSKPDTKATMLAEGTNNISSAMKKYGVLRLVVMSSYPMSGSDESMEFLKSVMPEDKIETFKPMIEDKINQEKAVQESGLDWTIVRPMMLTDGPKTDNYRVGEKLEVKPSDNISRADVADFLLKTASDSTWSLKIVTLTH